VYSRSPQQLPARFAAQKVWMAESSTVFPAAGVVRVTLPMSAPRPIFILGTLYSPSWSSSWLLRMKSKNY